MVKRLVDIDDELLTQAKEVLGVETMKEAVNRSLEEVVLQKQRLAWLQWAIDHADVFADTELQKGLHRERRFVSDE